MDPHISELSARLESEHWWFEARGRVLAGMTDRLVPGQGVVVEVGCGTGGVLSRLSDRLERIGIDPSDRAIELARRLHPGPEFRIGLAPAGVSDRLPEADLVLFCDVLEHIEEDVGTLSGVLHEMRPGARVLITVPADMTLWSSHDVVHGHVRRYEAGDLARFWTGLPVQHVLTSPFNWKLQPLARLVRWSSKTLGRTAGPEGTDLALPPRPLNGLMTRIFASELPRLAATLARDPAARATPGRVLDGGAGATVVTPPTGSETHEGTRDAIVVVPCYEEEARLDMEAFLRYANDHPDTGFLFVDDGSEDGTADRIRSVAELHPGALRLHRLERNQGKAEAVRIGLREAMADGAAVVGFWDADLASPLDELEAMMRVLRERSELRGVLGSRVRRLGAEILREPLRHYVGRVFATLASLSLGLPVYDTQCGAKLFRTGPALDEALAEPFRSRWVFDVELLARLRRCWGPATERVLLEYPLTRWTDVPGSKLRFYDSVRGTIDLGRIWWRARRDR